MIIGERTFDTENKTYVMGILNITPDSFSDGGKYDRMEAAIEHAQEMIQDGADIIDIGGESTRPGHMQISDEEEMERILPVVEYIHHNFDVPISVDTYKSKVAREALKEGAHLINDIWGLKYDKEMASVIAETGAVCCIMHNREKPNYKCFIDDVMEDLTGSIAIAKAAGIQEEKIILDPGVGFGKTYEMNLEVLRNLSKFNQLAYPVLLGTSRKSVIGQTLSLPPEQREEGTLVTTVMAVMNGCTFVRVHDIISNKRSIQMTETILGRKNMGEQ